LKLKNPKNSFFWVKKPKNPKNPKTPKNPKKPKKKQKTPKKTTGLGLKKTPGFFQPCMQADRIGHGYHVLEDEALYARCLKELVGPRKWVFYEFLDGKRKKTCKKMALCSSSITISICFLNFVNLSDFS
jgi:hypothetical protein